ncbi:MAG: PASTA domain-containing protein [Candidatus Zixiibacteriota bacterium]|nr:MAG: PASTA domain-containing protein [candidate division Zixibacteria bacterium]
MSPIQTSQLSQKQKRKTGFLSDKLPPGSLKRKIAFRVILPLLIILVLVLIVDDIIMPMITRHGDEFPLPDFAGLTLVEAQLLLSELDLEYEVSSEEFSPGQERGIILNQFPVADTRVKSGRVVKFVVSLGQKMVPVPELAGLSVRQAMLDLETSKMQLGEIAWAFSDTLPEKVVVFSYPAAGTEIPLGSPVNLMVNRGRASNFTYMPKVIGLTLDEAGKRLEDKLLRVGIVTHRQDENYLPETVLEQSEAEGTELDVGTEIDLVVSITG